MIILHILFFLIKGFLGLLCFALVIGFIRLFIFGFTKRYDQPITDISVLKKGDIILTGKQSALYSFFIQISNVLTRKTKHRFWTHAAIYRGHDLLWEAQPQGIIEKDINEYIKNGFIIRAFRHRYIEDESVFDKVLKFCADQEGCSYGTMGLIFYTLSTFAPISFNFLFNSKIIDKLCHLDKAYFCSELVVDAFEDVGVPLSPYDGWRVKPTDFISNPLLEPVTP